jgi:hypothetical protein
MKSITLIDSKFSKESELQIAPELRVGFVEFKKTMRIPYALLRRLLPKIQNIINAGNEFINVMEATSKVDFMIRKPGFDSLTEI